MKKPKFGYGGDFLTGGISGGMSGASTGASVGGPWGAAIGGAAGILLGGFTARKKVMDEDKLMNEEQKWQQQQLAMMKETIDKNALSNYAVNGNQAFSYYGKNGMKLPYMMKGGTMGLSGTGGGIVNGPSHEGGGVDLTTEHGTPVAEIEGGEALFGDKVFSRRLQLPNGLTFADAAMELSKSPTYTKYVSDKTKAEERGSSGDYIMSSTGKRELSALRDPMEPLFEMQEIYKAQAEQQAQKQPVQESIGKYGMRLKKFSLGSKNPVHGYDKFLISQEGGEGGFDYNTLMEKGIPFVDNIVNGFLTSKTPPAPKPNIVPFIPMKTKYNNDVEILDIANQVRGANTDVNNSYASSTTADNRKRANMLVGINAKMKSYQNKENIETGLKNQNISKLQELTGLNLGKLDAYNTLQFNRKIGLIENASDNATNAVEDAQQGIIDSKMDERDKLLLELLEKKYGESGVMDRNLAERLRRIKNKNKRSYYD